MVSSNLKINPASKQIRDFVNEIKKRKMTSVDIGKVIKNMRMKPEPPIVMHDYGTDHVRLGFTGDNHFGNRWTDKQCIHRMYKQFQDAGVDAVYNTGDLTDGMNMFKGQGGELYAYGISAIVKDVVNDYPSIPGVMTNYILGNHDLSYKKDNGTNIAELFELLKDKRPDLNFIGTPEMPDRTTVTIGKNGKTKITLVHPGGGTAFALSYKPQKIIENIASEEKPNALFMGHYHKLDYVFYRNVHAFQTGTTEKQTAFMASNNLVAMMGGWLVDFYMKPTGEIDKITYKRVV